MPDRANADGTEQLIRGTVGGSKCGKIWANTVPLNRHFPVSHPSSHSRPPIAGRKIHTHNGPIDDVSSFEHLQPSDQNADVSISPRVPSATVNPLTKSRDRKFIC
jgi:hypothetical protein